MMGLRGIPETEEIFEDCRVPRDNLLTIGFGRLMSAYNSQRVGAGTVALGVAQGAFEEAVTYAQEREQFGRPIAEFQGLHILLNLLDAAGTGQDGAYVRVLQTPGQRELREGCAHFLRQRLQRRNTGKTISISQLFLQPVVAFQCAATVPRNA